MKYISKLILSALVLLPSSGALAQGTQSLKINEVVVQNDSDGLQDEFGERSAWIEVANTSYGTVNLRNCYVTNNPKVLDKSLSAPERIALMSLISAGDTKVVLNARGMLVLFADGNTNRGNRHLNFTLMPGQENFIAIYEGNGVNLIDSVTVPAGLEAGQSYARQTDKNDKFQGWAVLQPTEVTPGNANLGTSVTEDKVREWKEKDPYGITMTVISMGIVFACLILLYVFFRLFGIYAQRWNKTGQPAAQPAAATAESSQNELKENNMDEIMAVIAMAIHESQNSHDVESDKITIVSHRTDWNRRGFGGF